MTPRGRKPYGPRTDIRPKSRRIRPLRVERLALGLTQAAAARLFGVGMATYQQWERGDYPAPVYWRQLMRLRAEEIKQLLQKEYEDAEKKRARDRRRG